MSFVLVIVAFVWIYIVSSRVTALEEQLRERSLTKPEERSMTGVERAALDAQNMNRGDLSQGDMIVTVPVAPAPHVDVVLNPSEPDPFTRFTLWLKVDFMVKLGAFLLLCALGWFVSYAFMNGWIGPMGRITLGLMTGAAFLILGYWRIRHEIHQGAIFSVLGSSIVLLTVYAGRELYDFFTPLSALIIMFLSVAFVALLAVTRESERLALASLALASIAPLFTASPYPDVVERFTYLLVIVFGSLWVVYLRGWSTLTLGALVVVFLHGLPYLGSFITSGDRDVVLLFAFVFTAIFFVANILGLICNENEKNRTPHLLIAGGTGLYLMAWIFAVAPEEWQSLLFVSWMLVFSVGSFIVYRVIERPEPFYLYGATSIALLGAATASELSGPALVIAYTIEIGALVFGATHIVKDRSVASVLACLFLLPVILSLESMVDSDWYGGIFHDSFFVLTVLMLTLGATGLLAYERAQKEGGEQSATTGALLIGAGIYLVVLIWLVFHAGNMLSESTATLFALLVYAVAGIIAYTRGRQLGNNTLRYVGWTLIALVMGRLLLIEVWNMEIAGRIITFFIIGLLFLSTAFLKKGKQGEPHL
jgi:uncharacterized membrane protein